jgi:hypothetical protein
LGGSTTQFTLTRIHKLDSKTSREQNFRLTAQLPLAKLDADSQLESCSLQLARANYTTRTDRFIWVMNCHVATGVALLAQFQSIGAINDG